VRSKCLIRNGFACGNGHRKAWIGIENPRVGGSIPPQATTIQINGLPVFAHCKPLCILEFLRNRARKTAKERTRRRALGPLAGDVRAAAKLPLMTGSPRPSPTVDDRRS
jgi:hypothetical protein